jgi:1-deoxy-D-xylulose 5-phosphate reductoisomerase
VLSAANEKAVEFFLEERYFCRSLQFHAII